MPTRIVCISDTHNHHAAVKLPAGDVLVHAGDISGLGKPREIEAFAAWFAAQPFAHKVVIAGNHDWLFEREPATSAPPSALRTPRPRPPSSGRESLSAARASGARPCRRESATTSAPGLPAARY